MDQRTTGKTGGASQVQGHNQGAARSVQLPPGGGVAEIGPFQLTYGLRPGSTNLYQVKVDLNGVFLNVDGSAIELSNIGVYFNLDGNDTLWIEGPVASLNAPTAAIKSYGNGDNGLAAPNSYWEPGGLTENDGATPPNQTIYRRPLASFVAGPTGAPVLATLQTTTSLQMFNVALQYKPATYPY